MSGLPYSTGTLATGLANSRLMSDELLTASVTAATAANTANTGVIDLEAAPYPTTEGFVAQVVLGAGTGGANTKNINIAIQHSSDNSNWANIPELATAFIVQACDANGNWAGKSDTVTLPPSTKEYLRCAAATEALGGTPTCTVTLNLLF
jgi:hypothetical protein